MPVELTTFGSAPRRAFMLSLFLFALVPAMASAAGPALIPMPTSVTLRPGDFLLTPTTVVQGEGAAAPAAAYLSHVMAVKQGNRGVSRIRLRIVSANILTGEEAYRISASSGGVRIEASNPRGLFYGVQNS